MLCRGSARGQQLSTASKPSRFNRNSFTKPKRVEKEGAYSVLELTVCKSVSDEEGT